MLRTFRTVLITVAAVCIVTRCASASGIDAIYAFGDSLTDAGNIYSAVGIPASPPYYNGEFSNGPVWVEDLAASLGLPALTPSRLGGTDYAYGSGETAPESFNISNVATDILGPTGQLAQYQQFLTSTGTSVDPNALYTIWIGSNDLVDIAATDPGNAAADTATVVANIDTTINDLALMGAKNFMILTVPDLGKTPAASSEGPGAEAFLSSLSAGLDTTLVNGSAALSLPSLVSLAGTDGINLKVLNTYALLDSIILSPATYGLTNVTNECISTNPPDITGPAPLNYTECSNPNSYLFWDYEHPTAAGHAIVADAALSLLAPEPGSLTLIGAGLLALGLIRRRLAA